MGDSESNMAASVEIREDSSSEEDQGVSDDDDSMADEMPSGYASFDPREDPFHQAYEVNNEFDIEASGEVSGDKVVQIVHHRKTLGQLHLQVLWTSGERTWETVREMKEDFPYETARYILDKYKSDHSKGEDRDRLYQWARKTVRDVERAVRRLGRLYDLALDESGHVIKVRRSGGSKKKKQQARWKFGVKVPKTVKEALAFDKENKNTLWWEAIQKEMKALVDMEVFEFHDDTTKLDETFQETKLWLIFDIKTDLRRKARLVAGGNLVELLEGVAVYSSTVKQISVRLLQVIAHRAKLKTLTGDVGNAYVNAFTSEKVYAVAGPEFGPKLEAKIVVIRKALYGLVTSAERWHQHFADTLRSFGFTPTKYDRDVWIRPDGNECYEYICIHVDDFRIFAKDPQKIMNQLQSKYTIKNIGVDNYFLGGEYKVSSKGMVSLGCSTYLKEALSRIENIFGTLEKADTPMIPNDSPELDESRLLDDEQHKQFQMMIGMLVWIVSLGRFDVAFATVSLSRFLAVPRKGHLDRVLRVFKYLKKRINRRIIFDSRPIICEEGQEQLEKDFRSLFEKLYPDAAEEVDPDLPEALIDEMTITVFHDSDHAHDVVTRRSISGIIIILGRTPVQWISKRQGAIETSTFGAEFNAAKLAVEELLALRYMLRCLGVKVTMPSYLVGDNRGVITNVSVPGSMIKKKHNSIAYHKVREVTAAGIAHPCLTTSKFNLSDMMTKAQTVKDFNENLNKFNPC